MNTCSWSQMLVQVTGARSQSLKIGIKVPHWSARCLNYWLLSTGLQCISWLYFRWISRYFSGSVAFLRKLQLVSLSVDEFGGKSVMERYMCILCAVSGCIKINPRQWHLVFQEFLAVTAWFPHATLDIQKQTPKYARACSFKFGSVVPSLRKKNCLDT